MSIFGYGHQWGRTVTSTERYAEIIRAFDRSSMVALGFRDGSGRGREESGQMTKQVFLALARGIGVAAGDGETARATRDTV